MTDEELMTKIRAGDNSAYEAIVRRHLKPVSHYAWRMLGNQRDVEDIAQDTFLKVWINAASWQPAKAKFSTWVHRIAHNLCIDHMRKRREQATDEEAVQKAGPLDEIAADDDAALLRAALGQLPQSQHSAILLCHYLGFSNKEAAAILDVSVPALESLLARAKHSLRKSLPAESAPTENRQTP